MEGERPSGGLEARKAIDFLQRSELINLEMPVSQLVQGVSDFERVAGYVVAWDRYVVVVGAEAQFETGATLGT